MTELAIIGIRPADIQDLLEPVVLQVCEPALVPKINGLAEHVR